MWLIFSFTFFLPLIIIFRLFILIEIPNFLKNVIKSKISGSIAQFDSMVLPSAPQAAINAFSVAPTEIDGNLILLPIRPFLASAIIYPSLIFIFAPNFFKANKCISTGRVPIAQPPGNETLAFLYLVNNGPKTKTPALIVFTSL